MAMTQRKLIIAGAGAAVIAIGGWVVASHIATNKAEETLKRVLSDNGLAQSVQWRSLSASPLGHVTLKDVSIAAPGAGITIESVEIGDWTDTADRKRGDVQLTKIATTDGFSPLGDNVYARAGGIVSVPPMDGKLRWDIRSDDDTGKLSVSIAQPDGVDAAMDIELARVSPTVRALELLTDNARTASSAGNARGDAMASFNVLGGVFGLLKPLSQVEITSGKMHIVDRGYVKRSIALYKRYNVPVIAGEGDAEKQRNKAFEAAMERHAESCLKDRSFTAFADRKEACGSLVDFLQGDEREITLTLAPKRGVPLMRVFDGGVNDRNGNWAQLAPVLKN